MKNILFLCLVLCSSLAHAQDLANYLAGKRLVMDGASCAGMAFKNKNTLLHYAEMTCTRSNEADQVSRIKWLAPNVFAAIESKKVQENAPPRVLIFKIEDITPKTIRLREIWTGWGNLKDDVSSYRILGKR